MIGGPDRESLSGPPPFRPPPLSGHPRSSGGALLPYQHTTLEALPAGDVGVELTLQRMRRHVQAARTDPGMRAAVLEALRGVREKDQLAEAQSLFEWVLERTRFTRDPRGVELLQEPTYLLRQIRKEGVAYTDCDDATMLFAALAETAGYPTRFRVQGAPGRGYSHVLVDVLLEGRWVSFDASQRRRGPGWRPGAGVAREAVEGLAMTRWYHNGMPEPEIQYEREGLGQLKRAWEVIEAARARATAGRAAAVSAPARALPPGLMRMPWFQRYKGPPGVCPPEARGDGWLRQPGTGLAQALSPPMDYEEGLGQEVQAQPTGWLAQVTGAVTAVAESAVPLLERYGVLKPRVYTPTGGRIYVPPVPVGGAPGAAFQALTTPVAFGLTGTQLLLLGGGALALLLFLPRGR